MDSHELKCPYCSGAVHIAKVGCSKCNIDVEGVFNLPRIAQLPPAEAAFLTEYILAEFNIKKLEKRVGMSYPAIRTRLNRIIESMGQLSAGGEKRRAIVEKMERGEITAKEAIRQIGDI